MNNCKFTLQLFIPDPKIDFPKKITKKTFLGEKLMFKNMYGADHWLIKKKLILLLVLRNKLIFKVHSNILRLIII